MNICVTPEFLPGSQGQIFTVTYSNKHRKHNSHSNQATDNNQRPSLLFIPPFAEEANKSRHMLSALGRTLAQNGIQTTILDLFGCGDSEGDIDQANLRIWHQDINKTIQHMQRQTANISIGGLRLGATIALDFLATSKQPADKILIWQPVLKGEQFIKQFIRIKLAGSIATISASTSTTEIIAELEKGNIQEIAGYSITKELFQGINKLNCLNRDIPTDTQLHLLEINPGATPSTPMAQTVSSYTNLNASHHICQGSQFWACQEIVYCDSVIEKSIEILTSGSSS